MKHMYCGLCAKPITKKFDIVNIGGKPHPVHKHDCLDKK